MQPPHHAGARPAETPLRMYRRSRERENGPRTSDRLTGTIVSAGSAPTHYAFAADTISPDRGSRSACITAKPRVAGKGLCTPMQLLTADDYRGSRLMFSGYRRTPDAGRAQMWMRVDGPDHQVLALRNMDSLPVTGTAGWKRCDTCSRLLRAASISPSVSVRAVAAKSGAPTSSSGRPARRSQ